MLRKLTILLLALLPLALPAQLATGSWKVYPAFGSPDRLIETPRFVYLATSGSLHSYDKDNDESRSYEPRTDLGGDRVKDIFYNFDNRYLLVVYEDANIDIIPDEGERLNLPDIKDANVDSKVINDVAFGDGKIYIATSFGLVIYNDTTFEVDESGIFNVNVSNISLTKDRIVIVINPSEWKYYIASSPKSDRHNNITKFKNLMQVSSIPVRFTSIGHDDASGETHFAAYWSSKKLYHITLSDNNYSAKLEETPIANTTALFSSDDGAYAVADGRLYHITAPFSTVEIATIPEPLREDAIATLDGSKSIWAANINGLGNYKLSPDGSLTVLRDKYRPEAATTFSDISLISPLSDNRGFIVSNRGMSAHFAVGNDDFLDLVFTGNILEDSKISNIDATEGITFKSTASNKGRREKGDYIFSPTFILEDPDDHSVHYIGSGNEGIYVMKDGRQIGKFDENSLINKNSNWAWRPSTAQFDNKGNLLVGVYTNDASQYPLIVLPADKRRKSPSEISKEDWVGINMGGVLSQRDIVMHQCSKLPAIFMSDAQFKKGFVALHYGSSITDTSDDTTIAVSTLTDQDGKTFAPDHILCFAEDRRGRVWAGTTEGIFEITNPANVFSTDFRINRLKVPRNDGTNLADYLLDTEKIYAIAVDAANRKWIATDNSGVYLVSENGDEIIENFNTTNSPLPTNCITDLYVDPNSNSLFIATLNGLYEYSTSASPSRPDYSDVIAYPNPVTPDYTGLITIRGLMDSSLVKIMDAGMHLVYQTTSEGGMATWDGCTLNGSRVKSGVYYVFASVSSDTDSQGDVVAKILVIN